MAKLVHTRKFSKCIISCLLAVCIMTASAVSVLATGSYSINTADTENRFYTEFFTANKTIDGKTNTGANAKTADISRQTILYTYLFKGETVYFGSSVSGSYLDENDVQQKTPTNVDIVVTTPDGAVNTYANNSTTGEGYIANRTQEKNGPSTFNDGGYTPHSFTAAKQGKYIFKLHSKEGSSTNPTITTNTNTTASAQKTSTIAFWDITVADAQSNIKHGRTYTNYLALNTGNNNLKSNFDVYVLTSDGFIYDVNLKDVDPYGFIFFANNQGLTTTGLTPSSIYHSVRAGENSLDISNMNVTYHKPNAINNTLEETFLIFFEKPSDDLKNVLYSEPETPKPVTDIKFHGFADGKSYYAQGGYFSFRTEHASSVSMTIDFTQQINLWLGSEDESIRNACNTYLDNGGSCIVQINGAVTDGENIFFWDGCDSGGLAVPAGSYGEENVIKVTAIPKAGEIHFPFLDVENLGGISVERVNSIDGVAQSSGKYDLYYNNNPLKYCSIDGTNNCPSDKGFVTLADETVTYDMGSTCRTFNGDTCTGTYNEETKSIDFKPVDTSMSDSFMNYTDKSGDQSLIDCWTYYSATAETVSTVASKFEIIKNDEPTANVFGRIFYDQIYTEGENVQYKSTDGDYPITPMRAIITNIDTGESRECLTNARGIYYFYGLTYGTYSIRTDLTKYYEEVFKNTSNNDGILGRPAQEIVIDSGTIKTNRSINFNAADIGYQNKDNELSSFTVNKKWADNTIPAEKIHVRLNTYTTNDAGEQVETNTGRQAYLDKSLNWTVTFDDIPAYHTYFITEEYLSTTGEYVKIGRSSDITCDAETIPSSTVTNNGYISTYDYVINGKSKEITITNETQDKYKVEFHSNLNGNSNPTYKNDVYKIYRPADTEIVTKNKLSAENTIDSFYDIPDSYDNDKVFAGWYYDSSFGKTDNPVKWDTDVYSGIDDDSLNYSMDSNNTYHIYAHWIDSGTVTKNASGTAEAEAEEIHNRSQLNPYNTIDNKVTGQNFYKGFDLAGVQIKRTSYDPNYPEIQYGTVVCNDGLRFLNVLSEDFLAQVNGLFDGKQYKSYTDAEMEYGDVVAKESKARSNAGGSSSYKLEYNGKNVNGVDTTSTYGYVKNAICTSSVPVYSTGEVLNNSTNIIDHRNFTGYRLYTTVITYNAPTTEDVALAKQTNIISRAYIRYVDANGLLRTHYNDYSGNSIYGGCSTNYNYVNTLLNNQVGEARYYKR